MNGEPASGPPGSDEDSGSQGFEALSTATEVQGSCASAPMETQGIADEAETPAAKSTEIDPIAPICEIRPPDASEALSAILFPNERSYVGLLTGAVIAAVGMGWVAGWSLYGVLELKGREPIGRAAIGTVVERIISAESNGDANAKNRRSSATGLAQFLDGTWLEMIRAHRPDLVVGRSDKEILELRHDPGLAREITARLVEQNAAILSKRGLPVTPGTLYLTHFAGAAGAVAILSMAEDADAASLMARADTTGRMTREKIVGSNPFLARFTVADLKSWADRKMRGHGFSSTEAPVNR